MSDNRQIIPFPLPMYLATYFGNKLSSNPELMTDGSYAKPFHVDYKSVFGKYVLNLIEETNRKQVKEEGIVFYISVSNTLGSNYKDIPEGRVSHLKLSNAAIKKITSRFKAAFEMQLMSFISGVGFEYKSDSENGRYRTRAIRQFCKENNVMYTPQNLNSWKKQHQRLGKTYKELIYSCL